MKRVLFACAAIGAMIAFAPRAVADRIAVTYSDPLTGPFLNNVYVNSGIDWFYETETFTNLTAYTIDILDVPPLVNVHDHDNDGNPDEPTPNCGGSKLNPEGCGYPGGSGDPNDDVTSVLVFSNSCTGAELMVGEYCTIVLQVFVTGEAPYVSSDPDTDLPFGDSKISFVLVGFGGRSGNTLNRGEAEFVTTVYGPAPTGQVRSTPEPGSLALLGSGIGVLGLGVFLRRRHEPARRLAV